METKEKCLKLSHENVDYYAKESDSWRSTMNSIAGERDKLKSLLHQLVPQTAVEALLIWGIAVINCPPHEYDNRTTVENAEWITQRIKEERLKHLESLAQLYQKGLI